MVDAEVLPAEMRDVYGGFEVIAVDYTPTSDTPLKLPDATTVDR